MTYISFVLSTLAIREGEDMTREGDPGDFMENMKHQCNHQIERLYTSVIKCMTYISLVLSTLAIREGEDMTREGDFMET